MKAKTIARVAGTMALGSLLFWAFTGLPLWAPLEAGGIGFLRGMILAFVHLGGLLLLATSFDPGIWKEARAA